MIVRSGASSNQFLAANVSDKAQAIRLCAILWARAIQRRAVSSMDEWRKEEDTDARVRHMRAEDREASKTTVIPGVTVGD